MRVLVLPAMLAACMQTTATPPGEDGSCSAAKAQALIGRQHSEALGKDALRRTGAKVIRLIRPGQAVTMDYRTDRLNIGVDERDKVIRITCG